MKLTLALLSLSLALLAQQGAAWSFFSPETVTSTSFADNSTTTDVDPADGNPGAGIVGGTEAQEATKPESRVFSSFRVEENSTTTEAPFDEATFEMIHKGVVGGTDALDGEHPYQVSLRKKKFLLRNEHFCGGSIIARQWILTAAHCVHGDTPAKIVVVAGTNKLNSGGTKLSVAQIFVHPGYVHGAVHNDIALLKLSSIITYSEKMQPVVLATVATPAGTRAVVSGWGLIKYPGKTLPNKLKHVSLLTVSTARCKAKWATKGITDKQVCTYLSRNKGVCRGDSGGPLMANGKQIGVVSFGMPCAVGQPDVFASVAAYRQWIKKVARV